jgi:hypothetical protein
LTTTRRRHEDNHKAAPTDDHEAAMKTTSKPPTKTTSKPRCPTTDDHEAAHEDEPQDDPQGDPQGDPQDAHPPRSPLPWRKLWLRGSRHQQMSRQGRDPPARHRKNRCGDRRLLQRRGVDHAEAELQMNGALPPQLYRFALADDRMTIQSREGLVRCASAGSFLDLMGAHEDDPRTTRRRPTSQLCQRRHLCC